MNKQELIEKIEAMPNNTGFIRPKIDKHLVLGLVRQLDEPEKVTIPQFVAQYIEWTKGDYHLLGAMGAIMTSRRKNLYEWFYDDDNMELFARAWLDGYEVEKEPKYIVKMKRMHKDCTVLKKNKDGGYWYLGDTYPYSSTVNFHTRKELEDAGFGWMFDCPGIEIEEVQDET